MVPEVAEAVQPGIDFRQWVGLDRVDTPRPVSANGREPALAKHLQLLRDRRLRDRELPGDYLYDFARRVLALGKQLENSTTHRIAEDFERMHQPPVYAAIVRSAFARASSGSSPEAACAAPHASPLPRMKALP